MRSGKFRRHRVHRLWRFARISIRSKSRTGAPEMEISTPASANDGQVRGQEHEANFYALSRPRPSAGKPDMLDGAAGRQIGTIKAVCMYCLVLMRRLRIAVAVALALTAAGVAYGGYLYWVLQSTSANLAQNEARIERAEQGISRAHYRKSRFLDSSQHL